jgi:hypothetical protein
MKEKALFMPHQYGPLRGTAYVRLEVVNDHLQTAASPPYLPQYWRILSARDATVRLRRVGRVDPTPETPEQGSWLERMRLPEPCRVVPH